MSKKPKKAPKVKEKKAPKEKGNGEEIPVAPSQFNIGEEAKKAKNNEPHHKVWNA